jgi:hypothetical protein
VSPLKKINMLKIYIYKTELLRAVKFCQNTLTDSVSVPL